MTRRARVPPAWVAAAEGRRRRRRRWRRRVPPGSAELFGYGATRDAGATNTSVWTYLRVRPRSDGITAAAAVDETLWLEEHTYRDEARPLERRVVRLAAGARRGRRRAAERVARRRAARRRAAAARGGRRPRRGASGSTAHATSNEPWVTQWVDNVQLASGALRSEAHVPVAVARNGQQFDVSTNRSYAPRRRPSCRPSRRALRTRRRRRPSSSGAPTFLAAPSRASATRARVRYRCRFGNVTVDAARNASDGSLRCVAPPQPDADGPLPLAVSLNGGDDFGAPIPFDYLGAAVASCTPAAVAATRRGGGDALAAAEAPTAAALCRARRRRRARRPPRRCASPWPRPRVSLRRRRRGAGVARRGRRRRGVAPPAVRNGTANGTVPLALSLNGQDVAAATAVNFTYWAPPAPPRLPAARRAGRRAHRRHDPRRRLRRRRRAAAVPLRRGRRRRRTERVRRHARVRRAARRRARGGTGAAAADCELHGAAALAANGTELRLTSLGSFDAEGSAVCGAAAPSWGAGALEVSMRVLLGEGGEGVSLSYGEGGEGGTGERGAGMGLRLSCARLTPAASMCACCTLVSRSSPRGWRAHRRGRRCPAPSASSRTRRASRRCSSRMASALTAALRRGSRCTSTARCSSTGCRSLAGRRAPAGASRSAAARATARPTYGCGGCACARARARARSRCR